MTILPDTSFPPGIALSLRITSYPPSMAPPETSQANMMQ